MNKAKRIVDNMDSENAFAVCSEIGIIDENATPLKQARYINELLNTTESMKIYMTDTMRKCGGCCLSTNAIKIAKKIDCLFLGGCTHLNKQSIFIKA